MEEKTENEQYMIICGDIEDNPYVYIEKTKEKAEKQLMESIEADVLLSGMDVNESISTYKVFKINEISFKPTKIEIADIELDE